MIIGYIPLYRGTLEIDYIGNIKVDNVLYFLVRRRSDGRVYRVYADNFTHDGKLLKW
jgi:hypothetical protein